MEFKSSPGVGGAGARLRAARHRQNLTLDEVAICTRIPRAVLEHIERDAFDRLPAAVFTKGYLRAFAGAVALDPEEIVADYLAQWPAARCELPVLRRPAMDEHRHDGRNVVATVVIAAIVFAYSARRQPDQPIAPLPVAYPPALPAPGAAQAITDSPVVVPAKAEGGVRLEVEPTGECWVSAVADGELVVHRLLQAGERTAIRATSELVVRVGDPGTFAYTVNGAPGRPLGDAGVPVTVTITDQNYSDFVDGAEAEPRRSDAAAA